MVKKVLNVFLLVSMIISLSGCIALLLGAGGTALWQKGKIISEESVPMDDGIEAIELAFEASSIILTEKVVKIETAQIRGKDQFNTKVAVDVFHKGPKNIRIEIRYGLGDEMSARSLLNEVKKCLEEKITSVGPSGTLTLPSR